MAMDVHAYANGDFAECYCSCAPCHNGRCWECTYPADVYDALEMDDDDLEAMTNTEGDDDE